MAETQTKRPREQHHELFSCEEVETSKRHKNRYNQILSVLDDNTEDEQQETTQDLTDFLTSLKQELACSDPLPEFVIQPDTIVKQEPRDGHGDKEMMIRHLLEASDDELGIPNIVAVGDGGDVAGKDGGFPSVVLSDGLWELEDDATNYYTLLHSELIM